MPGKTLTLACSLLLFVGLCQAEVRYELSWDTLSASAVLLQGVTIEVIDADTSSRAEFAVQTVRIKGAESPITFGDVRGSCARFELSSQAVHCLDAVLVLATKSGIERGSQGLASPETADVGDLGQMMASLGEIVIRGDFVHQLGGDTQITSTIEAAAIRIEVGAHDRSGQWQFDLAGQNVEVPVLWKMLALETDIGVGAGTIQFSGGVGFSETGEAELKLDFTIEDFGFENSVGTVAGAALGASGSLYYAPVEEGTAFDLKFQPTAGEALLDFAYLQFDELTRPLVSVAGIYGADRLELSSFSVETPGILSGRGEGIISFGEDVYFNHLKFDLEELNFPVAAERYLDSILARFGFAEARFEGSLKGRMQWDEGALSVLEVSTNDLVVNDSRLSIEGLSANVFWSIDDGAPDSEISWTAARVYDLELGAVTLPLRLAPRRVQLLEPSRIPVFDGAINFAAFELASGVTTGEVDLILLATIEAISLAPLSAALGWPQVEGTLAGEIPRIEWVDGVLELGGAMLFEVFDGEVVVDNVSLERPFGVLTTFAADVDINKLDLQLVTSAFEFGEIRGRLDGRIQGLRLLDWQPVAFDAVLQTPRGDRSKHKISQRAVDNLSSLGGGAGAALQQTFLRFFESFSYDQLGLRCVLSNNICSMSGVEKRGNGFYIVKGKGIPRIDVVGFQTRVDWPQLLSRLKAASGTDGITID